jgi:hypothetical protein
MGTMERQAWLQSLKEPLDPKSTLAYLHVFKKVVSFERPRWEWMPNDPGKKNTEK